MQKSQYLVANEHDLKWGLTVSTVGYEEIAPGDPYPTHGHADGYYFNVKTGRELNEYQLLYIVEGEGLFRSEHFSETKISEGDMFLLFPGERHSYHPLPHSGWKKYWIGFKGKNIDDRMAAGFLSIKKPIYHIGYSADVIQLYKNAYNTALQEAAFVQQMLAGIVNHMLGIMYAMERNIQLNKKFSHIDMINRARLRIREAVESNLTIQQIAEELGMSYSNFRKLFKEYTGMSPALYQQDLKLQRAKELLTATDMSIKEIAYRLNFDSPDYFSAKFKIKTGRKPSEMRQH
ncbi:MAG: helix-turn-helix domain-containing protein [Prevotella sp.]